ncbi:periplasmic chaperone for outer membrane proteins Skp [Breznakibacter xylanolyticus]|uniref:Periplasmic chaperone for outer membrane proteins Skp n=1 Tax=Breznakibacter xylanolyticus TaxID=990 RepID=A0A2W7NB56_9BACT|nr:OmpH family outer membrane protein [Breznakibacter xylanolyticus]PZX17358.1 periplasmic chaperone for outer membrane proteins Skp [Breznakibacter xylanolyticus]
MNQFFNQRMKSFAGQRRIVGLVGVKLAVMLVLFLTSWSVDAQKFAFVDTDYILKRVPAYEAAQEQLNVASQKWQQEVEKSFQDVSALYKSYQTESVFLSPEMKAKRENEIVEKEKQAKQLQQKYFGNQGELFKKREALIKPIQDDIYSAISAVSNEKGLSAVFDKASNVGVLFTDPKIDISDEVIKQMGL